MEQRGIISSLFDLDFNHLITPRLQKILYVLLLAAAAIAGIGVFVTIIGMGSGFFGKVGGVIGGLIMGPLVFVLLAIQARVAMEFVISFFKGVEYLASISASVKR